VSAQPVATEISGAGAKRGTEDADIDQDVKRQRIEPIVAASTPPILETAPAVPAVTSSALEASEIAAQTETTSGDSGTEKQMAPSESDSLVLEKDVPTEEATGPAAEIDSSEANAEQPEIFEGFELQEVPDDVMKEGEAVGEAATEGDDLMLDEDGEIVTEATEHIPTEQS
jgi:hypothetical protein